MANDIKYYKVGGFVRDQILGIPSKDIDYAVEAPSFDAMVEDIKQKGGQIFLATPVYLTVRAKIGTEAADFVLCRKDGAYSDSRHPDTVEVGTLYDDLARRDFTMNAIAIDEVGHYVDPHNGIADIAAQIIRCVGSTHLRFKEDALRILRAIRFAVTKHMILSDAICTSLCDGLIVGGLANIAPDRIREELNRAFAHDTLSTLAMLQAFPMVRDVIFRAHPTISLEATMAKR